MLSAREILIQRRTGRRRPSTLMPWMQRGFRDSDLIDSSDSDSQNTRKVNDNRYRPYPQTGESSRLSTKATKPISSTIQRRTTISRSCPHSRETTCRDCTGDDDVARHTRVISTRPYISDVPQDKKNKQRMYLQQLEDDIRSEVRRLGIMKEENQAMISEAIGRLPRQRFDLKAEIDRIFTEKRKAIEKAGQQTLEALEQHEHQRLAYLQNQASQMRHRLATHHDVTTICTALPRRRSQSTVTSMQRKTEARAATCSEPPPLDLSGLQDMNVEISRKYTDPGKLVIKPSASLTEGREIRARPINTPGRPRPRLTHFADAGFSPLQHSSADCTRSRPTPSLTAISSPTGLRESLREVLSDVDTAVDRKPFIGDVAVPKEAIIQCISFARCRTNKPPPPLRWKNPDKPILFRPVDQDKHRSRQLVFVSPQTAIRLFNLLGGAPEFTCDRATYRSQTYTLIDKDGSERFVGFKLCDRSWGGPDRNQGVWFLPSGAYVGDSVRDTFGWKFTWWAKNSRGTEIHYRLPKDAAQLDDDFTVFVHEDPTTREARLLSTSLQGSGGSHGHVQDDESDEEDSEVDDIDNTFRQRASLSTGMIDGIEYSKSIGYRSVHD